VDDHSSSAKDPKKMPNLSIFQPLVRRSSRASNIQETAMAAQNTRFQNLKLIAGAALIGFGVFIQSENLPEVAARVTRLLGISAEGTQTFGVLVAVGLAASHTLQAYLFDHREFLRSLYRIPLLFWPLLAVVAGTVLLRNGFTEEVEKNLFDLSISSKLIRRVSRAQVQPVDIGRQTGSQS
jgi:hypothetical protein